MQDSIKCRQLQQLLAQAHQKINEQNREISALRHMASTTASGGADGGGGRAEAILFPVSASLYSLSLLP